MSSNNSSVGGGGGGGGGSLKKTRSDFIFLKTIGEGSFSTVYLAEEKSSGLKFASKLSEENFILLN